MKSVFPSAILVLLLFSCNQSENKSGEVLNSEKKVNATGYVLPADSMSPPVVIPAGKPEIVQAGKPVIIPSTTNTIPAGEPPVTLSGSPSICTPGSDTFSLPKSVVAKGVVVPCGIPEMVPAKDIQSKDVNPSNFSFYQIKQGLKNNSIQCMIQDRKGNIWFATYGGGATKYDGKYFTTITSQEGLANDNVFVIFEDSKENFWFGTNNGLSKYDGKQFTNYSTKDGLSHTNVYSIAEDKKGNLWIGTKKGVSEFDGKTFTSFTEKQGLVNNANVYSVFIDKNENIWFGTNAGLSKYDGKSFTNFTDKQGLSNVSISSCMEDQSGKLWFGTIGGGIEIFDGKSFTNYTTKQGLINDKVSYLLKDKSGTIWIGTFGGLSKYDGHSFTNFSDKDGLTNNKVFSLFEDGAGNLWIGTFGGGVCRYDGKTFSNFTQKEGLSSNNVYSIFIDKPGNFLFGTFGGGLDFYDGKNFTVYSAKQGLSNNTIYSILKDKSGNYWYGTYGSGVIKFDGISFTNYTVEQGLINNSILDMIQDKNGNLWFVANNGGASKFDGKTFTNYKKKQGLCSDNICSVMQDHLGNIWFGSIGGGISKYDGKIFTTFSSKDGLGDDRTQSILEDKMGNIWIATYGGGVSKYDGKVFKNFTVKNGLSSNYITSVLEDKKGNLWFGTKEGFNCLSRKNSLLTDSSNAVNSTILFKSYASDESFFGSTCFQRCIAEDADGNIWIGTEDRLMCHHPEGDNADTIAPDIQLTGIDLFNEKINWQYLENKKDTSLLLGNGVHVGDFEFSGISKWYSLPEDLSLAYNNNYLTFNFIGITTKSSKKVQYQYKLDGLDENWSALANRNDANYGNLPFGTYTFKVKAMNSEGCWSKEYDYTFTIRPPWWKTIWFRTLSVILILGSVIGFFRYRTAALRKRQKELEQTVVERTAEVVQQKHVVEEKQKEITDSINYAKRIQYSLLAHEELLKNNLPEHFVLFKPKDIVSGDFYWATEIGGRNQQQEVGGKKNFYLAVCDSTGHGVPGAFMSLLNISFLNEAINEKNILQPNEVLDHVRNRLIQNMEGGQDGMDATLVKIEGNNFTYASAHNKPVLIRNNEIITLEADKMPVGKGERMNSFSLHSIQLQKGDAIYFFTDGFADQFGGPKGKKFKYSQLNEKLIEIAGKDSAEQKNILEKTFEDWKGSLEQVDDVLVIGIKIN